MKKNIGSTDRTIRIATSILIGALLLTGLINGITAFVVGVLAIAFLGTSMIGFCPLYIPFKISTCKEGATHPN